MATDIIPIGDVQTAMRQQDDYTIDDLADAAMDPVVALEAVTGMRADSLLYQFKVGGAPVVGFTVKGAKTMASRRGGFEVHAPEIEYVQVPVEDSDGNWIDVPGVRATVRVTDKRNDNTFCAVVARPRVKILRDGSRKLDEHCEANAVSRATRNAIMDHFWGVADVVKNFVVESQKAGKVYVVGTPDAQMEEVSRQQAVNTAKRRAMRTTPLGNIGRDVFLAAVRSTALEAGLDPAAFKADLDAFQASHWPGLKLAEIPATDTGVLGDWLVNKRRQLGLPIEGEEQAADSEPDDARETQVIDYETGEITNDADEPTDQLPIEPEKPQTTRKPRKAEPAQDTDEEAAY